MKLLLEKWNRYLNEDFPPQGFMEGSIYREPLYHGSDYQLQPDERLDPDKGAEYGIYLSPRRRYARRYGKFLYQGLVNIQNPIYIEGKYEISPRDLTRADVEKLKAEGYDSIVVSNDTIENASEIVAFDPEQVHVLEVRE